MEGKRKVRGRWGWYRERAALGEHDQVDGHQERDLQLDREQLHLPILLKELASLRATQSPDSEPHRHPTTWNTVARNPAAPPPDLALHRRTCLLKIYDLHEPRIVPGQSLRLVHALATLAV